MSRYHLNSLARAARHPGLFSAEEYERVSAFYDAERRVGATPLHRLPALASDLGIGELMVKDESLRFDLPAFKILGVWYAVNELRRQGRLAPRSKLVCATSGNHGRAVARAARLCGCTARVYVPSDALRARIDAIAGEGAEVIVSSGNYNDAVLEASRDAARSGWHVISDTSSMEEDAVPRLIMAGYTRLGEEAERQWTGWPDLVLVQGGVGGLLAAIASWLAHRGGERRPWLICCEPTGAACLYESARAGSRRTIGGALSTKMEGLRSGEVSAAAWPAIQALVDAFVVIDDEWSFQMMRRLARPSGSDPRVTAGASGACGLAALAAICEDEDLREVREACGLGPGSRVLVFNTEGATDPALYEEKVAGRRRMYNNLSI